MYYEGNRRCEGKKPNPCIIMELSKTNQELGNPGEGGGGSCGEKGEGEGRKKEEKKESERQEYHCTAIGWGKSGRGKGVGKKGGKGQVPLFPFPPH